MKKCIIFTFGGSGVRILEKLLYLMAAGSGSQEWEIVPVVIDLDKQNGDLNKCLSLLEQYYRVHQVLGDEQESGYFFGCKIKKPKDLDSAIKIDDFLLSLHIKDKNNLAESIEYNALSNVHSVDYGTQMLVDLFYSKEDLDMPLLKGFKGNPHIGTVFFGLLAENPDFQHILNSVNPQDRIFTIGSIFGGTGASGLPWLLKILRNADNVTRAKAAILQKTKIGVLSVMPYFKLKPPGEHSEIDSNGFITKTKAALNYYTNNLMEPNAIYYIGDSQDSNALYNNCEGGENQQNPPHATELFGALAVWHFLESDDKDLTEGDTISFRYGVEETPNSPYLYFHHIDDAKPSSRWLKLPLTLFYLSSILIEEIIPRIDAPKALKRAKLVSPGEDSFYQTPFYVDLRSFVHCFLQWLRDMEPLEINHHIFTPFISQPNIGKGKFVDKRNITPVNILIRNERPIGVFKKIKERQPDKDYRAMNGTQYIVVANKMKIITYGDLLGELNTYVNNANRNAPGDSQSQKAKRMIEILYRGMLGFLKENKHQFISGK